MSDPEPTSPSTRKVFRLSAVTTRIRDLLLEATKAQFWVKALFVPDKGRGSGGHCYGHLVENDDNGVQVAKLRAVIWKSDLQRIERLFLQSGLKDALRESMEVCALAGVRFHPVHGLTLNIFEIDPTAGESRVERNRREILELLEREGLLHRNRELSLIAAPLRIGLITAPDSAALADFVHTLQTSPFAYEVILATAAMQGEETARTVTQALEHLSSRNLDLICIIRGGGSPLDLAWLDDIGIARAVALCPLPVWVGIGHEIDVGVLDHVAHTSHKTPTAVAKVLVRRLEALDERLQSGAERLQEIVTRRVELAGRDVARLDEGLRQGARKHLEIRLGQFLRAAAELETSLTGHGAEQESRFRERTSQLLERSRRLTEHQEIALETVYQVLVRNVSERLETTSEYLDRGAMGLTEGSRKHQDLIVERHRRRLGQLSNLVLQRVRDRAGRTVNRGLLLRERAQTLLRQTEIQVSQLGLRAVLSTEMSLRTKAHELRSLPRRVQAAGLLVDRVERNLAEKGKRLEALDPARLLDRGYSVTRTSEGRLVRSPSDVEPGERIHTQLRDGTLVSRILSAEEQAND